MEKERLGRAKAKVKISQKERMTIMPMPLIVNHNQVNLNLVFTSQIGQDKTNGPAGIITTHMLAGKKVTIPGMLTPGSQELFQ